MKITETKNHKLKQEITKLLYNSEMLMSKSVGQVRIQVRNGLKYKLKMQMSSNQLQLNIETRTKSNNQV